MCYLKLKSKLRKLLSSHFYVFISVKYCIYTLSFKVIFRFRLITLSEFTNSLYNKLYISICLIQQSSLSLESERSRDFAEHERPEHRVLPKYSGNMLITS